MFTHKPSPGRSLPGTGKYALAVNQSAGVIALHLRAAALGALSCGAGAMLFVAPASASIAAGARVARGAAVSRTGATAAAVRASATVEVLSAATTTSAPPTTVAPTSLGARTTWCAGEGHGRSRRGLVIVADAGTGGSNVFPGQLVTISLTWDVHGGTVQAVADSNCVALDGRIVAGLTESHVPAPSDGKDTFAFTVPTQATPGERICDRVALSKSPSGRHDDAERGPTLASGQLCFAVGSAAVLPESSSTLALPLVAAASGVLVFLVGRRRARRRSERGAPQHAT